MASIPLQAKIRTLTGKKTKYLRQQDVIPGVVYGHNFENQIIEIPYNIFAKAYKQAGSSSLVDLEVEDKHFDVLIHEVEQDPVTDRFSHIDFLRVSKDQKLVTNIPLEFVGESMVIKEMSGVLITPLDKIEVRCLPSDLVSKLTVDISVIAGFNQPIHVRDLKVPSTMEVLSDMDAVVATITPPKKEEEAPVAVAAEVVPEAMKKEQEAQAAAAAASKEADTEKKKKE